MERKGFIYNVSANVEMTGADLNVLLKVSKHHYDGKCKDASARGGFLYGWANRFFFQHEPDAVNAAPDTENGLKLLWRCRSQTVEVEVSARELDTMAKIMEMSHYHRGMKGDGGGGPPICRETAAGLILKIPQTWNAIREAEADAEQRLA